jgi:hypothetical protein
VRGFFDLLTKEDLSLFLKVLVLSIFYKVLMDTKMHTCTGHVIGTKDIVNPGLTFYNTER